MLIWCCWPGRAGLGRRESFPLCAQPLRLWIFALSSRESSVLLDVGKETGNQREGTFETLVSRDFLSWATHPGKDEHSINNCPCGSQSVPGWLAQMEGDEGAFCGQLEAGSERELERRD